VRRAGGLSLGRQRASSMLEQDTALVNRHVHDAPDVYCSLVQVNA
jgi:hypothetical protein